MKFELFRPIFEKASNIKFHENPSSGSRVLPCGQMDGWIDVRTKGSTDGRKDGWMDRQMRRS